MSHQKGARDGLQVGCQSFVFEVSVLFEGEVCWVASGGKVTQDTALPWVRGWRSLQVYSDGDEWRSVVTEPEHQWERIGKRRILIISLWQCLKGYPQKKRHSTATARCVQFLCCRLYWSINHGPSLYVQWGVVPRVGFIDPCGWSDGSWPKNPTLSSRISPNSLLQCWPATSSCSSCASFPARPSPHNTRQVSLVLFW